MAVTGTGTQADPFIVHSYDEFMSLKDSILTETDTYIQFFENERPNQTINCNDYGSEFKWGQFDARQGSTTIIHINLNGCTIKNFLIADGESMFPGYSQQWQGSRTFYISNGSFRNVFLGSPTSKFCDDYVHFQDVSISFNFVGATGIVFNGAGNVTFDNCAMYLVGSTLQEAVIKKAVLTDTDIELHIADQNGKTIFIGDTTSLNYCTLQDCRIQGKIGGTPISHAETGHYSIFGCATPANASDYGKICKLINCVIDVDLTDSVINWNGAIYWIYKASGATDMNTNVLCNSHYPSAAQTYGYSYPTSWNYMSHEQIRNGEYLNSKGFTVVEVVGG